MRHALSSDGVSVLVLDGEADFEHSADLQSAFLDAIEAFISDLPPAPMANGQQTEQSGMKSGDGPTKA